MFIEVNTHVTCVVREKIGGAKGGGATATFANAWIRHCMLYIVHCILHS